ncbi:MAG TPA: bacteriohopanetetrol glucosamine biosynthesis glycosyltransferase HpnI [Candidatus Baltobacteraceae bacterium]|nr:bacteriohopanetetrol glucosamine biosynthesis glycosyltransferase HpnI [Candidatus Baltobacteraceae bacterium]
MTGWMAARDALLVVAAAPFVYYAVAIGAAGRFFRGQSGALQNSTEASRDFAPPVSILKPIRGLDRETYEDYASFCRQDYPDYEILFCVTDEAEPAIPVIEKLIRDFPERSIRLLIGSEPVGVSDKVNKLCRMAREARHEVLIVTDSDVRVDPGFLRGVVGPFSDSGVGGVTCLYRGLTDGSFAADLEALGNSADFAPGVLVAWLGGGGALDFMLGAVMATMKQHLAAIGGFEALADYLCDDYELGNRIAARNRRIELSRIPVTIDYPHQTLAEAFRHQLRWNLAIRYSRPWGHLGLIFTQGIVWMAAGILLAWSWPGTLGFVAAYSLLRVEVALSVGARGMGDTLVRRKQWMLPVRDVFAFVVWLASFFPQRIRWRDQEFYVRKKRLVRAA